MPKKLNVGIIGCGAIGKIHAANFAAHPRATVRGVCDIDAKALAALAAKCDAPLAAADHRELLADPAIDAIIVCLPNDLHCPVTLDALNAGKHVLCEKPIALNIDEARRMQKAARKNKRALIIGVVNRFGAYNNLVKQTIGRGELGEIYHVHFKFCHHRCIPGLGGWFTTKERAGGGVMIDWGVHFLDLALYCLDFPKPKALSGVAHARLGNPIKDYAYLNMWAGPPRPQGKCDVEECVSGVLRTSGPSLSFEGAWARNIGAEEMYLDFLGDKGGLRLNYLNDFTVHTSRKGALYQTTPACQPTDMYAVEIDSFVNCVLAGKTSPADIDSVLSTQQCLDAFYASAAAHKEVAVK